MIGIAAPEKDISAWVSAINAADDSVAISVWPDLSKDTQLLVCWNPPTNVFDNLLHLKAICVMGAGTDGIKSHPELPTDLPVYRLENDQLASDMYHHVYHCIESWRLNFPIYRANQNNKTWQPMVYRNQKDIRLTILGLGHIGSYVAERLTTSEYNVRGWSNSIKTIPGVETFAGMSELTKAVTDADVVICLLALNEQTRGIIDDDLFSAMAEQSCFINVARGAHLDDDALIKALDTKLICAFLDVFANEPLPEEHPFWERNEIVITPHIASLTDPGVAAEEVLQRYYALK